MNNVITVTTDGLQAARAGRGICGKLNAKTSINGSSAALTDSGFLYAIPEGKRAVITCFYAHLNTATDYCDIEWGYTGDAGGTGTFTPLTVKFRIETGAANAAETPMLSPMNPPLVLNYDTAKCFTARVQTNDAGASLNIGFHGWYEDY